MTNVRIVMNYLSRMVSTIRTSRIAVCTFSHFFETETNPGRIDHGVNDPVAHKILAGAAAENGLAPPLDTSIVRISQIIV